MKNTTIISAFPGTGKTHYFNNKKKLEILDSDSSTFDKSDFPKNYIKHIKDNLGKVDIIFVSSHKEVRDALVKNNLEFKLIYPYRDLKKEYLKRYLNRGNNDAFVNLLDKQWQNWMSDLENQTNCIKIRLHKEQYIGDVI